MTKTFVELNIEQSFYLIELLKEPNTRKELILKSHGKQIPDVYRNRSGAFKKEFIDALPKGLFKFVKKPKKTVRQGRKRKKTCGAIPEEIHINWELFAKKLCEAETGLMHTCTSTAEPNVMPSLSLAKDLEYREFIFNKTIINKLQKAKIDISFLGVVNICLALAFCVQNPESKETEDAIPVIEHVLRKKKCKTLISELLEIQTENFKELEDVHFTGIERYIKFYAGGLGGVVDFSSSETHMRDFLSYSLVLEQITGFFS